MLWQISRAVAIMLSNSCFDILSMSKWLTTSKVINLEFFAVRMVAAGIKLVGVPKPKPMHGFSPNFQGMFTPRGSRAD